MGSDGALWRVLTRGGADIVLRLTPSQMSSLLFEVECAIEHVMLIDLRPYNGMRWIELSQVRENHPGYKLAERLRAFDFSVEIFRRNSQMLIQHLEKATGPLSLEQIRWDRRFEIDTFIKDSIHLLLNFVAVANALVDHSRSFYPRVATQSAPPVAWSNCSTSVDARDVPISSHEICRRAGVG